MCGIGVRCVSLCVYAMGVCVRDGGVYACVKL